MSLNIRNEEVEQELMDAIFTQGIRNLFKFRKEIEYENSSSNTKI